MKNTKHIIVASLLTLLIWGCGSKSEQKAEANYLPDLKAEIPTELQDNKEIVEYINVTTEALNQMSRSLEDLYVKIEPFAHKEEADLSTMEKLKLTKYALEFTAEMAKVGAKMATMQETYTIMADDLTEDEKRALEIIQSSFYKRIEELNKKYENLNQIEIEQDQIEITDSTEIAV